MAGRSLLTVYPRSGDPSVGLLDVPSRQVTTLAAGVLARYVRAGYLVVAQADGSLIAARFDASRGAVRGGFTTMESGLSLGPATSGALTISDDGTFVHALASSGDQVVRVSRGDRREEVVDMGTGRASSLRSRSPPLFAENMVGDSMFIVKTGTVRITSRNGGSEGTLAILGPGEHLGELALLARSVRLVSAVAETPCELVEITQRDYYRLQPQKPQACLKLALAIGTELAARVARFLGRTVATSRPFDAPTERPAAEGEARSTLEAAERLQQPPSLATTSRLPAYLLMGSLHNLPDGQRQARALLEPLLVGRPEVQRERLRTLRALLTEPGPADAAAALGVHRNTLAYRARRIEGRTGWRLTDPEQRLPLLLAIELVQI